MKSQRNFFQMENVCIIGGGPAGLGAALVLSEAGVKVTLVQEARGLGGRACTRMPKGRENPLQFDFGVQMLRLRGPLEKKFKELNVVERWPSDPERLVKIYTKGAHLQMKRMSRNYYVGTPRMSLAFRALAESAGPNLTVVLDRSAQARKTKQKWECTWKRSRPNYGQQKVRGSLAEGQTNVGTGEFDSVILAFEALKIVQGCKSGYKRAKPSATYFIQREAKKIKHHQIRVLMIAFEEPLNLSIDGAEIHGHPRIRWIANNSSKPNRPNGPECWVIHSSVAYGCKCEKRRIHKNEVTKTLKRDFFDLCRQLGAYVFPRVVFTQFARWGACTSSTLRGKSDFVWDEEKKMGACGDWCKRSDDDLYSRVCDAYESGAALAKHMLLKSGNAKATAI